MKKIVLSVINSLGSSLGSIIVVFISTMKSIVSYLNVIHQDKIARQKKKEIKDRNEQIDKAVNNGTINDLLNL